MTISNKRQVDVLIIGAGPMGLMTALWMAELGVKTCIIDDKGTRALNGRADGFHVRTAEIWDSFGIYGALQQFGVRFDEWCLWAPGDDGRLSRQQRQGMMGLDVSRLNTCTMHQGSTEATLLDAIRQRSGPEVERGVIPISMELDESLVDDPEAYPVNVQLRHQRQEDLAVWRTNSHSIQPGGVIKEEKGKIQAIISPSSATKNDTIPRVSGDEGSTTTIQAKYVVGSDGAHSWVRRQVGFSMEGTSTDAVWGVVDAVLITDFPDFRKHCTILTRHGTILSVPREDGMTRLYVQLPPSFSNVSVTDSRVGTQIIAVARQSLFPYTLAYSYCDWWTIYRVGQRVATSFAHRDRIFLGGDAVHTHTPKCGQGMNVSMQDAFNLGWKLAGVIQGQLHRSVLHTYQSERRPVAQDLINIDTSLASVLASETMSDPVGVGQVYERLRNYASGANICYPPSILVASATRAKQHLASHLKLGMRFPSHPVINHSSAVPIESQSLLQSDGRWRVLVFAGDVTNPTQLERVNRLGGYISHLMTQFRSIRDGQPFVESLLFYYGRLDQVELGDFHHTFFPLDASRGYNYNLIFSDPPASLSRGRPESAHVKYGISCGRGCLVVTRPDQCVGWIGDLEDEQELKRYFAGIMQ
ncbi:hypothetical protein N7467_006069 [Penicillium canescens]|nr:hypothetical protein N7467_006069 [Penicillium canescens]